MSLDVSVTPVSESEVTPVSESEVTPVSESEVTPVSESEVTPVSESVNDNVSIDDNDNVSIDDNDNDDIDDLFQQSPVVERPNSPVPNDIPERPGSPITVIIDQNDDTSVTNDEPSPLIKSTKIGIVNSIKKELLEEFTTMWSNLETPLNKSILVKILVRAMEIVEKTDIKGQDQQDVVINVLVEILESDLVVSVHKESMLVFLKEDARDVITLVVDASKGKININKLQNIAVRLFKKISACFA
jgi:hypothetical protein